jgi:formiminotetrahydrofolate cyclodeaminase
VQQQKAQRTESLLKTAVAVGGGLLGAFMGRKAMSVTNMNRAVSAVRDAGRSWKEVQDVDQAGDNLEQIAMQMADLQKQFDADVAAQQAKVDPLSEELETVTIRPKKSNISVQLLALAWQQIEG